MSNESIKEIIRKYEKKIDSHRANIEAFPNDTGLKETLNKEIDTLKTIVSALKDKLLKEFSGESCVWCLNRVNCTYNRRAMEHTREAVKGVLYSTKAYCSGKVTCDYYVIDKDVYHKYNIGTCNG